jgi:phosphate:Na+ symporter
LIKFVNILIPGKDDSEVMSLKYVDDRLLETPSIAVGQIVKEVIRMGDVAIENLNTAMDAFIKKDEHLISTVYEKEDLINFLEREITSYLVKLSQSSLTEEHSEVVTSLFHTINDLERIGDHSENLIELAQYRIDNKLKFSDQAIDELKNMYDKVYDNVKTSVSALETGNLDSAMSVIIRENEIDAIEKRLRADHIDRLSKGVCVPASGTVFLDMISNLERIADHANNIAQAVTARG